MDTQEILIAAGAIDSADIRPDGNAEVITGDQRLCFGPATTETGEPAAGWDASEYERRTDEDGPYWKTGNYTYAETDAEMIALAAKYCA